MRQGHQDGPEPSRQAESGPGGPSLRSPNLPAHPQRTDLSVTQGSPAGRMVALTSPKFCNLGFGQQGLRGPKPTPRVLRILWGLSLPKAESLLTRGLPSSSPPGPRGCAPVSAAQVSFHKCSRILVSTGPGLRTGHATPSAWASLPYSWHRGWQPPGWRSSLLLCSPAPSAFLPRRQNPEAEGKNELREGSLLSSSRGAGGQGCIRGGDPGHPGPRR